MKSKVSQVLTSGINKVLTLVIKKGAINMTQSERNSMELQVRRYKQIIEALKDPHIVLISNDLEEPINLTHIEPGIIYGTLPLDKQIRHYILAEVTYRLDILTNELNKNSHSPIYEPILPEEVSQ